MREFRDGLGSVRVAPPPKKTIKAYKLMRLQNGEVYPLFIDRSEPLKIGVWYDADSPNLEFLRSLDEGMHLIGENRLVKSAKSVSVSDVKKATSNGQRWILIKAAKSARRFGENRSYYNIGISESKGKETVSLYSLRPGWHAGSLPTMRQIGIGKDRNIRAEEQVWTEVELSADIDYTPEAQRNPDKDLPGQMPVDGYYMKATNANAAKSQADKVGWYIAGAMKIVRLVGDKEAREIINNFNKKTGLKVEHDYRRESGRDFEVENESMDGLGRNWYGGNSGYIGYSKSKRAVEAERRGLRNKSQMNREFLEEVNELLPPERRVTLKKIKENLDNMRYDEWHHTSKYGNKTYYYSAETVAKYFEGNSDERKEEKRNKEKHKEWLLQCLSVAQERLLIHAKSYADMLGYVSLEKDKNGNKYACFRASNGLVVVSLNLNEHYDFVFEGVLQENDVYDEYVNYYSNPKGLISKRNIFVLGDEAKTEEMRNLANEAEKEYFKMLDKLYNDVRVMPYKKEYEEAEKMYNEFRFQNLKGTGMAKITKDNMSEYLDEVAKANAEFLPLYKDAIDMLEFYDEDADIKENVDMTIEYANELLEKNAPKKEEKGSKTEDSKKEAEELEEWKKYIADLFKEKKKSLNAGNFDVEAEINDESIDVKVSVKDKKRFKLNFKKWVQNEHPHGTPITYDGDNVIWNCEKDKNEFKEACETWIFADIQYFLDAENYISMSDKEFQQKFEKLTKIQSETLWGDLKRMRNCSDSFIKECKNSISLDVKRSIGGDTVKSVVTTITIKSTNANLNISKSKSMTGCEWIDFDNLVTNAFKYLSEYLRDICDEADEKSEDEEETSKPKPEKKPKKASKPKAEKKPKAKKEDNTKRVAAITPEKKIIGDFCKLASFSGTASALKDNVRKLLNRLQNAIVQKQIRKTSKYANEIMSIQTKLVSFLNSGATGKVKVEIDNLDELMKIAKSEKVSENVMIARAFIRLNNKSDKMKEATALLKRINKAIEADIANEEVKMLKPSLESFISKKTKAVEPSERALRGLYGLAGVEDGAAANSMQLINQHYDVMTLSGRWKDFIGRPSKNFKMMVYGKPGQGKSTFSILFARYLAKEKGLRVLYVAAEEKFGYTLQEKIKRLEALTPNLDFAEDLTFSDLHNYDVVLLDSVNHLQMDADELATLPQNCAYVWIFQATKEGNYKGGQQYAHDSDIVIKVDSMKARIDKNRFGAANMEFDIEDYED